MNTPLRFIYVRAALLLSGQLILCTLVVLFAFACTPNTHTPTTKQDFIYGTVISLTLYDVKDESVFSQIFDRLRLIDTEMAAQKRDSEISRVNQAAGIKPVQVSQDTVEVLKAALNMARISNGLFDPTIGPIVSLWNIAGDSPLSDRPHVATDPEISSLLPLVDWHQIVLDGNARTIFLKKKGMSLDFGGIAKGFAANAAEDIIRKAGIQSAIISIGDSSIDLLGNRPDGTKWRVGVQNPEPGQDFAVEHGKLIGTIQCTDSGIDTSGPYERFFVQDGKRYHHIMDPRTGKPADSVLEEVTLVMPENVYIPDGLSTVCFVKGLQDGLQFIRGFPDVAALFVTSDKKVYVTKNMGDQFTLTDSSFTVIVQ